MTAVKYIFFAAIAIVVNLVTQYLVLQSYTGFASLIVAMAFGVLAGLFIKYILDKKFIFYFETKGKKDEASKFFLYSFMGIFTTMIFAGTEYAFHYCFATEHAKYVGGFIGLTIGYCIKYYLDKRFVFVE